jgi:hypothetical protein
LIERGCITMERVAELLREEQELCILWPAEQVITPVMNSAVERARRGSGSKVKNLERTTVVTPGACIKSRSDLPVPLQPTARPGTLGATCLSTSLQGRRAFRSTARGVGRFGFLRREVCDGWPLHMWCYDDCGNGPKRFLAAVIQPGKRCRPEIKRYRKMRVRQATIVEKTCGSFSP